ncbi:MAG TPA: hypothetical protein VH796_12340 [Nitrososphaeraceae archaeon]
MGNNNNPANGNGLGATTSGLARQGDFGKAVSGCATTPPHCG